MSLNREQREQFNQQAPSSKPTVRDDDGREVSYPFTDWRVSQRADYLEAWWDTRQGFDKPSHGSRFYELGKQDARLYAELEASSP